MQCAMYVVLAQVAGVLAADPAPPLWTREWWAEFWLSPAVGGLAAAVAAVFALIGVLSRAGADRTAARTIRKNEVDDFAELRRQQVEDRSVQHWWQMYLWTINHMDSLLDDPDSGIRMFVALKRTAPGPTEKSLVAVAIDMFTAKAG